MAEPQWHEPSPEDIPVIYKAACESNLKGCTDSYANIILYRKKYRTLICTCSGNVLRKYESLEEMENDISTTHILYGYPMGHGDIRATVEFLTEDAAKSGIPLAFPLLTAEEKLALETKMPNRYTFTERRDESDYLYLTKSLAELPGGKYHKKKNHIAQFMRKYPDTEFCPLSKTNSNDAHTVEELWFSTNEGEKSQDKEYERSIIDEALSLIDELHLTGGILYAEHKPVAMTIGSAITAKIADIHFEKAISGYDRDGAYAVINQEFAKKMTQYEYLNREEDLGIEGLRKAKLSYHPDILLAKWSAS
jgi:uncharacterized protein